MGSYDPHNFTGLTFFDARTKFREGTDTPSDYLDRCLDTIKAREPEVKAFVTLNEDGARAAAQASSARWRRAMPLSPIDGLPISIKDLLETKDMPTQMGCEAYLGNFPKRDNAAVWALREAGAVILGKTVTAELGGSHPGPTTNPFDRGHTPGGSSSGSAAAVACGMVPAAIGTQVGGSIIRPAGYCGNVALKPTQGGINRGERQATSMSTHGVHANCVADMWQVAIEIVSRVGGDRGAMGLLGPSSPPAASKPDSLVILETEGWREIDETTRQAFNQMIEQIETLGVRCIRRTDNPLVERLEAAISDARAVSGAITGWENRWANRNLVDQFPDQVSERAQQTLAKAESMTVDDYRAALMTRTAAQAVHTAVAALADAAIALSCPGPAPLWTGDVPGQPLIPRPTGDAVFNAPTSMLFSPAVSMPLLAVGGLPVGVQVIGQQHQDARMSALADWLMTHAGKVAL
jgi:Asp-tRNA(Asn)/Glu-tRNA(Gln) amidotransferase A subunit family amidase